MRVRDEGREARWERPTFSICIPRHHGTGFRAEAIRALGKQTFRNSEVCVCVERSVEGREQEPALRTWRTGRA